MGEAKKEGSDAVKWRRETELREKHLAVKRHFQFETGDDATSIQPPLHAL